MGQYYSGGADKAIEDEVIIDLTDIAKDIPNRQAAFAADVKAMNLQGAIDIYQRTLEKYK